MKQISANRSLLFKDAIQIGKFILIRNTFEIDLIIEENGIIYPVEIKMTVNPKASMASANVIPDKVPDRSRGTGIILCLIPNRQYLRENLITLPIEYI